jgi:hypothetical protein
MDKKTIEMILQFLSRTTLQGAEIQAFNQVITMLNKEREKLISLKTDEPEKDNLKKSNK